MPEFVYNKKLYYNPVEFVMDRIGGTWKMPLLWRLREKTTRYGELKKSLPKVSHNKSKIVNPNPPLPRPKTVKENQ
jgi:hypothetical protein